MALTLIIFLLFLSYISSVTTFASQTENDFTKWISWNAKNHQNKAAVIDVSINHRRNSLKDIKLKIAEMNKRIIVVSQDGISGDFKSIREAINSIPLHNTHRVILDIRPGIYREKITIPKTMGFITFSGDSSDPPTITGNDTASVAGTDGRPLKTYQSATVAINSDYFIATNIKFENTAPHVGGIRGEQAVALRISGTKNCVLNSVAKKVASLTAQKRSKSLMSSGFSFRSCNITGSGKVYLGRAWGDYSMVVFSYTFMDNIVLSQGWNDWGEKSRDKKVFYGEYKCSGPGANINGRVPWARILSYEEAIPFIGTTYIDGETWLVKPMKN